MTSELRASARWEAARLREHLGGGIQERARVTSDTKHAAIAMVLQPAATMEVLLMRRTERADDPWSGHVSCPGGRYEAADADLLATAIRETREELGIDLARDAQVLGQLAPVSAIAGRAIGLVVTPFVFLASGPLTPALSAEAARAFWFPVERAAAGEFDAQMEYRLVEPPLKLPCWRFDGEQIWGMTYSMLRTLQALALAER